MIGMTITIRNVTWFNLINLTHKKNVYDIFNNQPIMTSPLFAIPLNMATGTWVVTIIAGLGFILMFGVASAGGDYQGLINTTLENDALARQKKKGQK